MQDGTDMLVKEDGHFEKCVNDYCTIEAPTISAEEEKKEKKKNDSYWAEDSNGEGMDMNYDKGLDDQALRARISWRIIFCLQP
jgi:hypothetical protein